MDISCFSASEIQMMTLPPGQFVITDSSVATPVTTGQVKAVTPVSYLLMRAFLSIVLHHSPLPLFPIPQLPISELEIPPLYSHNPLCYIITLVLICLNYWFTVYLFLADNEFLESCVLVFISLFSVPCTGDWIIANAQ